MKFKIGDRVMFNPQNAISSNGIYIRNNPSYNYVNGIGVVGELMKGDYDYKVFWGTRDVCLKEYELELINNKTNMNLKEKFITAFLSEPEKTFRKAGITNGDGLLTDEGQKVFLSYLLKKEGTTFKTEVVDVLLAEEKE